MLLALVISLFTIVIPPLIMRYFTNQILNKKLSKEEKLYREQKTLVICIALAFLIYFPAMLFSGVLDKTMNFVDELTSNTFIGLLLFTGILIFPFLISIVLIALNALKIETNVKEVEIGKIEALKDIIKIFILILVPALLWGVLVLALPESIVSQPWAIFIIFVVYILLAFALAPSLILWLEKSKPVDKKLKEELIDFCNSLGVKVRDIKVTGKRKYKMANAGVTGIFPTWRYIFITEYMLENFNKNEIKAVLAHEIGHIKGKHLMINALLSIGWFAFWIGIVFGLRNLNNIQLLDSPATFFVVFFLAWFTYRFFIEARIILRNEFKADEFAAKVTGKETVIKMLEKLSALNLTPKRTGKWFNLLNFHPSIEERIEHLKKR